MIANDKRKENAKTLSRRHLKVKLLKIFPYDYMREHAILPLQIRGDTMSVAMADPSNTQLINELQEKTNLIINPILVLKSNIIGLLDHSHNVVEQKMAAQTDHVLNELNKYAEKDLKFEKVVLNEDIGSSLGTDSPPVVKGVNALILKAIKLNASDIHIEPYEKIVRVRYRVDGLLITTKIMPKTIMNAIVSRIKIMCKLNIAEKRLPQDGSFRVTLGDNPIDFRVSTLRTLHGEKIAMRILNRGVVQLNLATLGYDEKIIKGITNALHSPYGIILVTGPTGSGKSTTLYSMLDILNTDKVNISTAEDPVEYELEGINQVQCNPKIGLTFAASLRSFLRQDPDIIMVGEIRDNETAEIALKAALTGHLVLSTLHTNDTSSSIGRLINMGIEPFLISASLTLIMAQRLVRKICPHCKKEDINTKMKLKIMNVDETKYENTHFYMGAGCEQCNNSGYQGRSVIYEILEVNDDIRSIIKIGVTDHDIKTKAIQNGMVTLQESGMQKAISGVTSLDEIMRLTLA